VIGDWRPERRIVDAGLLAILKVRWDECCLCGETEDLHIHHIVYRSHSGDDVEANLCCLCVSCHTGIHSRSTEKWEALAGYIAAERSDTAKYLRRKLGGRALLYLGGCQP